MSRVIEEKIIFSWSGGKDSALALYEIKREKKYEIVALLTTVTKDYDRISMHGVRQKLLQLQSESLDFPLKKVFISKNKSQEEYEDKMRDTLLECQKEGANSVVCGDIFLEDLRKYREENLAKIDMKGIFPLWKKNTKELASRFINLGFKAIVTCVDSRILDKKFAGRNFDKSFLSELPDNIDPCGENGEFHSFVYDGPVFKERVGCKTAEIVLRDNRFYYCDLIPT